mmetsp:Transcript_11126/g.27835  ORF Transcript_11126/g.27835 Transcript_11126/m.27835 type:complete len:176 (-) Transcript_11126:176-703(-)
MFYQAMMVRPASLKGSCQFTTPRPKLQGWHQQRNSLQRWRRSAHAALVPRPSLHCAWAFPRLRIRLRSFLSHQLQNRRGRGHVTPLLDQKHASFAAIPVSIQLELCDESKLERDSPTTLLSSNIDHRPSAYGGWEHGNRSALAAFQLLVPAEICERTHHAVGELVAEGSKPHVCK